FAATAYFAREKLTLMQRSRLAPVQENSLAEFAKRAKPGRKRGGFVFSRRSLRSLRLGGIRALCVNILCLCPNGLSDHTKRQHRLRNSLEACDVRAHHVIAGAVELRSRLEAVAVDVLHDLVQSGFGELERPG